MAKESLEELLKQAIAASDRTTAASDRTTRAIRAFVLFLFIQLTFTSIAAFLFWIGASIFETAGIWDFQQRAWAYLLITVAAIILFVGVLVSSIMGWRELALSKNGLHEPRFIEGSFEATSRNRETPLSNAVKVDKYEPKENDGSRVCFKCETVYRANVSRCDSCNLWLDPTLNFKS